MSASTHNRSEELQANEIEQTAADLVDSDVESASSPVKPKAHITTPVTVVAVGVAAAADGPTAYDPDLANDQTDSSTATDQNVRPSVDELLQSR